MKMQVYGWVGEWIKMRVLAARWLSWQAWHNQFTQYSVSVTEKNVLTLWQPKYTKGMHGKQKVIIFLDA